MMSEQRENEGALFKNARKETDKHADYRGEAMVDGVAYYLDAWINTSKNGDKYMKLRFRPKEIK